MEIRLARHGRHIAIVTIDNQSHLNAMTRTMLAELGRLWDELGRDGSCRAIVLTGAGTRAFTVGADIAGDLSAGPEIVRMVNHALLKTDAYAKPIIAAVNGDCVGGGLELMLASDIRAAVPEARFGLTEVKWSIYPFGGSNPAAPNTSVCHTRVSRSANATPVSLTISRKCGGKLSGSWKMATSSPRISSSWSTKRHGATRSCSNIRESL